MLTKKLVGLSVRPEPYKPKGSGQGDKHSKPGKYPGQQQGQKNPKNSQPRSDKFEKLSKEERDRLRAEGCCFTCKETGHESRNCRSRKTAKAPNLNAGSMRFVNLEQLADRAQQTKTEEGIALGAMRFESLFQSFYDPSEAEEAGIDPGERFSISSNGDEGFVVWDRLNRYGLVDEYLVTRQQMDDPEVGVPEIIEAEWERWIIIPPRTEWGTGFPQYEAPDESYPALYWLRAHVASQVRQEFPNLLNWKELVRVEPDPVGYRVSLQLEDQSVTLTHQRVRSPDFDPRQMLSSLLEYRPFEDLKSSVWLRRRTKHSVDKA
ncbi:hypothetical protein C8T65DRAFT_735431 [Cerioporus squamosus]|nr:hypothetical protein C8T65DRAFT_735431 [Cerioporus squamosus]